MYNYEPNYMKYKEIIIMITVIMRLPVAIKESRIRTLFDLEISIPSVLGLSSGALM